MLGHVAQSVGGALPGAPASEFPILGQLLLSEDGQSGVIPSDAAFAFFEVVAQGGSSSNPSTLGGGGGGSDAIVPVVPGKEFSAQLAYTIGNASSNAARPTITYDGSIVVSSSGGGGTTNGTGKYPGSNGKGGGRLAGAPAPTTAAQRSNTIQSGHGCGGVGSSNGLSSGGRSVGHVAFFRTREAAVAFANSLYGGSWRP